MKRKEVKPENVQVDDTVYLNTREDAVPYNVLDVDGFVVTINEELRYKPQEIDRDMIVKVVR